MKAVITYDDDQDPKLGRDVAVTYVGNFRAFSQHYFNANAFPDELYEAVRASSSRFAIFHYQIKLIHEQIIKDKPNFIYHIVEPKMKLEDVLKRDTPHRFVAKYDGLELMANLHGLFYFLKSFLDVYASLLIRLVSGTQILMFNRGTVEGRKIAGGRLINWLKRSAPNDFPNAEALANLLQRESESWITAAVTHRDTLGHYSDIEDIHSLQVHLLRVKASGDPMFLESDIEPPRMPDGTEVNEYADFLGAQVRNLVKETLALFPDLDHAKLNYPDFDISEPDWPSSPIQ